MRNPWGNHNYEGTWWHGDSRWTPELKAKANLDYNTEHGIFFIPHDIFDEAYDDFTICYYQSYYTVQERKSEPGHYFYWLVTA